MFLPLLLLVCSVSTAELQAQSDNDILSHERQSDGQVGEAERLTEQQTCTQDIHAVLRKMSAWVAALKVEVQQLQRDNEGMFTELQCLNQLILIDQMIITVQISCCHKKQCSVENITMFHTFLCCITTFDIPCLSVCLSVKHLAFSASLLASGQGHTGPFNTHITLIFKHVVTNIGNAYNPNTGLFTAPVRGVYHFEFHIYGHGSTNPTSAELVKNRQQIFTAWTSQPAGGQKASNGVSLLLEIGDVVFLRMRANSWIADTAGHHTTFSGHLLFTM
uniref:C1q domain-containing protein n=1 Tax=Poecilia mexicana TaxID=48701 RepID=A0A3B3YIE4_9TELE